MALTRPVSLFLYQERQSSFHTYKTPCQRMVSGSVRNAYSVLDPFLHVVVEAVSLSVRQQTIATLRKVENLQYPV